MKRLEVCGSVPSRGAMMGQPRSVFGIVAVALLAVGARGDDPPSTAYREPYRLAFDFPKDELIADVDGAERGEPGLSARVASDQWYSDRTRSRWKSWGPPARDFAPPEGIEARSAEWKRQRAVALAARFLGYEYQHHHVPDWNPPGDWPWQPTALGRNGKGVDCSNFTSFIYNQGFGMKLDSDVDEQQALTAGEIPAVGGKMPLRRIELPDDHAGRLATLKAGDLLFVRTSKSGRVGHVAIWVGPIGRDAEGRAIPLVLDSHDRPEPDEHGRMIPEGVHFRPFLESSWYHRNASHALRAFDDDR